MGEVQRRPIDLITTYCIQRVVSLAHASRATIEIGIPAPVEFAFGEDAELPRYRVRRRVAMQQLLPPAGNLPHLHAFTGWNVDHCRVVIADPGGAAFGH